MPDLTLELMQQCRSLSVATAKVDGYFLSGLGSERTWPECTCNSYRFAKRTINFGGRTVAPPCKHIQEYQLSICGWHEQYSPETQTFEQKNNMICPKCGGPTEYVYVGV